MYMLVYVYVHLHDIYPEDLKLMPIYDTLPVTSKYAGVKL